MLIISTPYDPYCKYSGGPIKSIAVLARTMGVFSPVRVVSLKSRDIASHLPPFWDSSIRLYRQHPIVNLFMICQLVIASKSPCTIYFASFFSFFATILPLLLYPLCPCVQFVISTRGELFQLDKKRFKKSIYIFVFKLFFVLFRSSRLSFHVTSHAEHALTTKIFPLIHSECIPNIVDAKIESNCSAPARGRPFQILSVGRISPEKQQLFVLNFLTRFHADNPHLPFVCKFIGGFNVSSPGYAEKFSDALRCSPPGLFSHSSFLPNNEVQSLMRLSHVFISATDGENFGHAIYEAIANSMLLLIRDTTPFLELSRFNLGVNVSGLNVSDWSAALLSLFTDPLFWNPSERNPSGYLQYLNFGTDSRQLYKRMLHL